MPVLVSEARTRTLPLCRRGQGLGGHIMCREGEGGAQSLREEPACLEDMQAALHGTSGDTAREEPGGRTV